jgi:peptide/nickel transport system permease protein
VRTLLPFIGRRLLLIPVSMFVVLTLTFGLQMLIPGDPAAVILGTFASPDQVEAVHRELELDQPVAIRYVHYMEGVAKGDLGRSFFTQVPVWSDIVRFLPNTLELVVPALILAYLLGLLGGTAAAYFHQRMPDRLTRVGVSVIQSVPDFVVALVLIYFFAFQFRLVPPPIGRLAVGASVPPPVTNFLLIDALLGGQWDVFVSALAHMVLPVLTLGIVYSAYFAKTVRTVLIQAFASPQVEFARACGLQERVVVQYALLAARAPILTYGAILFGALIGGAAIVETIFNWRGIGQWALEGMLKVDVPQIQGFVLVAGVATLFVYLALDVAVVLLDPRVSYE